MSFFSFLRSIFGGSSSAESGGSITVSGGTSSGKFGTTLDRNNQSMLNQLAEARKYENIIKECAQVCNLPPSLICGIGSRESHWGLALKPPTPAGTGDHTTRSPRGTRTGTTPPDGGGYGRGLMQIDYDWHEFARTGRWQDPRENLLYAAKVLNDSRRFFEQKGVNQALMMQAMTAAYNAGATATLECIQSGQDVDCRTTGRDYSRDVFNRAGWFQLHGWA
jgi:hypothetical protein